jgi:hypothetical protein
MNTSLKNFLHQYLGVVLATLIPVILIAFLSIPVTLGGGHADDFFAANAPVAQHMT